MITLLAFAVLVLGLALGYETYRRKQDIRIYRGFLADESAERIRLIRQLQHNEAAAEEAIVNTQTALMYLAWRLTENGTLDEDDAPADEIKAIN
jgi:hypothetical protein